MLYMPAFLLSDVELVVKEDWGPETSFKGYTNTTAMLTNQLQQRARNKGIGNGPVEVRYPVASRGPGLRGDKMDWNL